MADETGKESEMACERVVDDCAADGCVVDADDLVMDTTRRSSVSAERKKSKKKRCSTYADDGCAADADGAGDGRVVDVNAVRQTKHGST